MSGTDLAFLGVLVLLLVPIVLTDLRERRIPNLCNLALAGAGLARTLVATPTLAALAIALVQAALTLAILAGTVWLMQRIDRNARIGFGDLKFLAAASFWVGLQGSMIVLVVASLASLALALAMAPWRGVRLRELFPFGPMLAASLLGVTVFTLLRQPAAG